MESPKEIVQKARDVFISGKTRPIDFRLKQLRRLHDMIHENWEAFVDSMHEDLRKPRQEVELFENEFVLNDIKMMINNLKNWAKPQRTKKNLALVLDDPFIISEPYGVVLVIGPWNYPLQLISSPFIGAIAAGNTVVLKPSEVSPATGRLLQKLIPKYMDTDCYHMYYGGVEETTSLLKEKFDYIFYTGSTFVGKIVHKAANEHLTPVTLELGGKCPAYVDDELALEYPCRRILWGKLINSGQTCVAPDYILCTHKTRGKLVDTLRKVLEEFYGKDPKESNDLGRIVAERHVDRLEKLLQFGEIAIGGVINKADKYISPTVLIDVKMDDPIMKEEIFGPILPIITVKDEDEAISFINKGEKPLSLYVFTTRKQIMDKFTKQTSSGSLCINDSVVHLSIFELPFGGVGMSGMGKYHGEASFKTFSHQKSVLIRGLNTIGEKLAEARYPPYSKSKTNYLKFMLKRRREIPTGWIPYFAAFLFGVLTCVVIKIIINETGNNEALPEILQ